jgi:hypothetical protein
MLLSLLNSHSTGTSAHSGTCMNERTHNFKASVLGGAGRSNSSACALADQRKFSLNVILPFPPHRAGSQRWSQFPPQRVSDPTCRSECGLDGTGQIEQLVMTRVIGGLPIGSLTGTGAGTPGRAGNSPIRYW